MKILFLLILSFLALKNINGQKIKKDDTVTCLQVAKEVAYYWKLDSLASNGFRLSAVKKFLDCKIGIMYVDVLLNILGEPNEIWNTNKGTEYIYYYHDARQMPKQYKGPESCRFVAFKFQNKENTLSAISEGDIDR